MAEKLNPAVADETIATPAQQAQTENVNAEEAKNDTFKSIVKSIVTDRGGKMIKNLRIKNCTWGGEDAPNRLSFTLRSEVDGYVRDENDNFELGKVNVIYVSNYALAAIIKEMDSFAWLGNSIANKPKIAEILMSNAKIDIVQESVAEGTPYVNPFSKNKDNEVTFDHDVIINYVANVELSNEAKQFATSLALNAYSL